MVIEALNLVPHCYTWEDGIVVGEAIRNALKSGNKIVISFAGVEDVPSSFVNAAFVALLDDFTYEFIRENISVVSSTRQINDMIKKEIFKTHIMHTTFPSDAIQPVMMMEAIPNCL